MAVDCTPATELIEWADRKWADGEAGGHPTAVQPGLAQAEKLKEAFPGLLEQWLANGSAEKVDERVAS